MNKSGIETIVGLLVLLITVGSVVVAYKDGGLFAEHNDCYVLRAEFDKVDGVNIGSPVKISGINVGKVIDQVLDKKNYYAVIKMKIKNGIRLPIDTSAEVVGLGLINDKYVSLIPGSDDKYLSDGGVIEFTQSSLSLESLIAKFIFGSAEKKSTASEGKGEGKEPEANVKMNNRDSITEEIESIHMYG